MATLLQQLNRAQEASPQNLINALFKFIRSIEKELEELNRKQLHEASTDVFGKALGFYSKATEYITTNNALLGKGNVIKKEGDPYDMKDTNTFLPSIYAKVFNDVVVFGATDPKLNDILDNPNLLTKDLFGLTDENLTQVIKEKILPFFQLHTRQLLGL